MENKKTGQNSNDLDWLVSETDPSFDERGIEQQLYRNDLKRQYEKLFNQGFRDGSAWANENYAKPEELERAKLYQESLHPQTARIELEKQPQNSWPEVANLSDVVSKSIAWAKQATVDNPVAVTKMRTLARLNA